MNQAKKITTFPQPINTILDNEPTISDGMIDQPDLRLDRARRALRGLSQLTYAASVGDVSLYPHLLDISELISVIREELEAGLTGKRLAQ